MYTIAIIFHDGDYYSSGGTRSMIDIVDTWSLEDNLRIIAIFPTKKGSAIDYLQKRNIKVLSLTYGLNLAPVVWDFGALIRVPKRMLLWFAGIWNTKVFLSRKLKSEGIDLLYTNTSTPHVGAWLKKDLQVPHIWHFREFGEENQDFSRIWGNRQFYQTVNSHTDSIVVISEALRAKVEKYTNLPIKVIYDDVSPLYVNSKQTIDFVKRPLKLLVVGELSKGKGQIQAIQAIEILDRKGFEVVLYIAGTGPESAQLRKYVKDHALDDRVIFLGFVKDMNALRKSMQVGVVCSRCEAFGRVTIEGMLSNLVMIGADTGGTPELIQDGKTGMLYHWNNIENLAAKIEYIYHHPKDAVRISKEGFASGLAYTKGRCAEECKALIEGCIKDGTLRNASDGQKKFFQWQKRKPSISDRSRLG
jgi:glycosyltransferase involved in cell wall biosynthesis